MGALWVGCNDWSDRRGAATKATFGVGVSFSLSLPVGCSPFITRLTAHTSLVGLLR